MGLFDTVKEKANALAADAERAGKVTAAQARTVVLQNDIRKAERELGHATFLLIEAGELTHPELKPTVTRLRSARRALQEKEAEITALRGQTDTDAAPEAAAPLQAEAAVPAETTAVAVEAAGETAMDTATAPESSATPGGAAAKKPAAKKTTPKKAAAKKTTGKDK